MKHPPVQSDVYMHVPVHRTRTREIQTIDRACGSEGWGGIFHENERTRNFLETARQNPCMKEGAREREREELYIYAYVYIYTCVCLFIWRRKKKIMFNTCKGKQPKLMSTHWPSR